VASPAISAPSRPPRSDADGVRPDLRVVADVPEIERIPWSVLGPEFIAEWGRPRGKNEPEHVQILGPSGSGKGVFQKDVLLERARRRQSQIVFIATKPADKTTLSMGWPVTDTWRGVTQNEQVVYWPRTALLGAARKNYMRDKIMDVLGRLWTPDSNTVVVFDEIARMEKLGIDVKEMIEMYFTEGRGLGITCVFGKQRTQGVGRDTTGNTDWKITFRMNDQSDTERVAELFGRKQEYVPVVNSLDRKKFEFLIQHKLDLKTFISWVDRPVRAPAKK
jgi:hypothetical protein